MSDEAWIGRMVGDYQIVSLLGEGGMGKVFQAVHVMLGQTVAVKMLQPELMSNQGVRTRFEREAHALARLNHPNMVNLINYFEQDGTCFIVMEFTDGKDIEKIMEETGLITPDLCCQWYDQVLSAMAYAHSQNIIHRDIKPSNIMITSAGPVKVLDFGTAKLLDAPALTKQGMTLGTVIYMSPEQLLGRKIDARSDIYSLGVTLYEMCTGRLPFEDAKEIELVKKIARAEPTHPTVHYPYLPTRMEEVILKSISKKAEDRFQSVDEFRAEVLALRTELANPAPQAVPMSMPVTTVPAQPVMAVAPIGESSASSPAAPAAPSQPGGGGGGIFLGLAVLLFLLGAGAGAGLYFGMGNVVLAAVAGGGLLFFALVLAVVGIMKMGKRSGASVPAQAPQQAQTPYPQGQPQEQPAQQAPQYPTGALQCFLLVMEGSDKGNKYPIPPEGVTIGRGEQNTIPLNDPGVSTAHAQIVFNGNQLFLQDVGSRNGTYVNNQKVTQHVLENNDIVVFGNTMMVVNLGA